MNSLVTMIDGKAVTTSLTIAEGTEVQHKNVLELVRTYQADLEEFGRVAFETAPFETAGGMQQREVATLNEQQSTLLLTYMRNSDIVRRFKKALVKAFFDLIQQASLARFNVPATYPEAMRLAADLAEARERLTHEVQELKPKAEFHDRVVAVPDAISIAEAAKIIGTGRNRLLSFLRQHGWVTRKNEPYQARIESGYMDVKLSPWEHPTQGLQRSVTPLITGKGLTELQALWSQRHKEHAA